MKRYRLHAAFALLVFVLSVGISHAQKDKSKFQDAPPILVSLGTLAGEGAVPRRALDALLNTGLVVNDTKAAGAVVDGFTLTFVEHVLYEDSVGNPLPKTDFLVEYYSGSKIPDHVLRELRLRAKPGDTLLMERVKVRMPNGQPRHGTSVKVWVTP